jgi:UDP-2-acetamido-2-deoxy-ribo-hexuluronate aminotransferase
MIQMYDPKREYQSHKEDIDNSIQAVLNHGLFINGPEVKALEPALASFTGAKHAITCSNGTDALKVAMLALEIGPGDEVITVAHTWISTVEMISIINAVPVFCDICPDTFNMDHTKLEALITDKTKAIMPVSLYGQTANMDAINEIANKYNVPVIEDGAQSFGAMYKGKRTGNLSTIGTTSFFPSKPLGCYGDGGALFTNDDELNDRMRKIKNHGALKRFQHKLIGMNARLDSIQAAVIGTKLKWYNETMNKRNKCANYYTEKLENIDFIETPFLSNDCYSVWAQYSLLAPNKEARDFIVSNFKNNGVNSAIFYPAPLHIQECFKYLNYSLGDLPVTEEICDRIFNLPCYGEFTREEQDKVIKILKDSINILVSKN